MNELDIPDLSAPKKPAIPRFRVEAVAQPFRSKEEGRPIYADREMVDIIIPGDRRAMASEIVNDEHKQRWPKEYEAFKNGLELPLEGTPLANWPNSALTRSRVEELAYFNIRTVEHLAALNDNQLQNIGMGARELRGAAQKFLEVAAKGTAPLERMINENFRLKDENARKDQIIAEQAEQIAALSARKGKSHAGA